MANRKRGGFLHIASRLFPFVRPYKNRYLMIIATTVITAAATAALPKLIQMMMDKVFVNPDKDEALFYIYRIALLIMVSILLKDLGEFAKQYLTGYIGERTIMNLRNKLFQHFQHQSLLFHHRHKIGSLISRIVSDVTLVQESVSRFFGNALSSVFKITALIGVMFWLNWKLSLLVLAIFPLVVVPIYLFGRRIRKAVERGQEVMEDLTSVLYNVFTGIRVVKAFRQEQGEINKFSGRTREFFDQRMRMVKSRAIGSPLVDFISGAAFCVVIVAIGRQIIFGWATWGQLIGFCAAAGFLHPEMKNFTGLHNSLQEGMAALERIFNVLEDREEVREAADAQPLALSGGEIVFENVSFAYQRGRNVLRNINLRIKSGQTVALVGRSGAGKSTLADLVPRFYDVGKGRVSVGGMDVRNVTLSSLRDQIGIITQEVFLFNDTIRNNITYGRPEATSREIDAAARAACAQEFIKVKGRGAGSVLGDRGVTLSGGERQRLAIARAILRNPPIMIMDEATSSLDTESELKVQTALNNLMKNRTTLVIAHRLSTVRNADKIIVLDQGRIVEQGTHASLIRRRGLYKKLYDMQFKL